MIFREIQSRRFSRDKTLSSSTAPPHCLAWMSVDPSEVVEYAPKSFRVRSVALAAIPGRVERVGRMSGRGSPALAGGLPYPSPPRQGLRESAGWRAGREGRASGKDQYEERNERTRKTEREQQTAGRKREAAG